MSRHLRSRFGPPGFDRAHGHVDLSLCARIHVRTRPPAPGCVLERPSPDAPAVVAALRPCPSVHLLSHHLAVTSRASSSRLRPYNGVIVDHVITYAEAYRPT